MFGEAEIGVTLGVTRYGYKMYALYISLHNIPFGVQDDLVNVGNMSEGLLRNGPMRNPQLTMSFSEDS